MCGIFRESVFVLRSVKFEPFVVNLIEEQPLAFFLFSLEKESFPKGLKRCQVKCPSSAVFKDRDVFKAEESDPVSF